MRGHRQLNVVVATALAVFAFSSIAAANDSYRVELLVLRHLNNEGRSFEAPVPEDIPLYTDLPDIESAETLKPRVAYRNFPRAEMQLSKEFSQLRRSRDFRPLVQLGWTQESLRDDDAGWVPVSAGAQDGTRIQGDVKLAVSRYLHLYLELEADIPGKGVFHLAQRRRMRSGDLHYFDHPEFGVLAIVVPEPRTPQPDEPNQSD